MIADTIVSIANFLFIAVWGSVFCFFILIARLVIGLLKSLLHYLDLKTEYINLQIEYLDLQMKEKNANDIDKE